ncbi:hypothetical protein MtrunA17_Chr5g0415531 [Medicago truncatula]|uniref:Uncharacterized protein n=1 Tax=Medicago truncatula TaxID=3880 RepID=A0A396HX14_MEDTR|nr:hypothetical protein MtrunA17_Chr5g0415531 [Medicago truncatula]
MTESLLKGMALIFMLTLNMRIFVTHVRYLDILLRIVSFRLQKLQGHKMQYVAKPNTSSFEVEKVDEVLTLHTESTPNNTGECSKVVEEDPLITDMIRSKETVVIAPFSDIVLLEESCEKVVAEPMRDVVLLEELYEEVVADSLPLRDLGKSIVVMDPNLSNFNANVIHDMQVLGIISAPTPAQQAMNFLSDSWANMSQNEEIDDLADHQFQLVVPRNKKKSKPMTEASKGFEVGSSN